MNIKNISFSAILLLSALMSRAQTEITDSKFYIKAYGGYGFLTPGSYRLLTMNSISGEFSQSKQGLGNGVRFGGGIGVIASDFLNIGVDVDYLSGSKMSGSATTINPARYSFLGKTEMSYTALSITPHVIFKALSKPDYLIYNKLGILLNLPMELKQNLSDTSYGDFEGSWNSQVEKRVFKVGLTVGLNVALGVQVRLTDKLRGFSEIFANYLVLSPTDLNVTSNGVNKAPGGTPTPFSNTSHTVYVKDGTVATSSDGTQTQPVSGNQFNMNTIGINIGVSYRF
jgi:hypothetical protein